MLRELEELREVFRRLCASINFPQDRFLCLQCLQPKFQLGFRRFQTLDPDKSSLSWDMDQLQHHKLAEEEAFSDNMRLLCQNFSN